MDEHAWQDLRKQDPPRIDWLDVVGRSMLALLVFAYAWNALFR